jgi:hypothetical protein
MPRAALQAAGPCLKSTTRPKWVSLAVAASMSFSKVRLAAFATVASMSLQGVGVEMMLTVGFGWTNGVAIRLAVDYGDLLRLGPCPP